MDRGEIWGESYVSGIKGGGWRGGAIYSKYGRKTTYMNILFLGPWGLNHL